MTSFPGLSNLRGRFVGGQTSESMNESLAPAPSAAHLGFRNQKEGLARNGQDGLFLAGRAALAFNAEPPLPIRAKLRQDVGQAISRVADTHQENVRKLWDRTL